MKQRPDEIETLLIAPCCWRQPISDHQSEIVSEMKVEIRQMLDEGKDRQEDTRPLCGTVRRPDSIHPSSARIQSDVLSDAGIFHHLGIRRGGGRLEEDGSRQTVRGRRLPVRASRHRVSDEMSRRIQKELDEMDLRRGHRRRNRIFSCFLA